MTNEVNTNKPEQPCPACERINQKTNPAWLSIILFIFIIFIIINNFNFLNFNNNLNGEFSWWLAFLVGLSAGISTCLALVGGLVLGLAANYAKDHQSASALDKFKPHLYFNLGRIISFFILGGLLGLIGQTFKISSLANSALTLFVGFVILLLGFKILEIFPILNRIKLSLPASLSRKIKTNNSFLLGSLSFFLPCGFTQAMQIYALGSGHFIDGAIIMSLFALGTVPGLLSLGGLASFFSRHKSRIFPLVTGSIVIIFALINISNGFKLLKINSESLFNNYFKLKQSQTEPNAENNNSELQTIKMIESGNGYSPNTFTLKKGRPVRWIIDAQAPYSCASALIVPQLNIDKQLKQGENIIEFTPNIKGQIKFSCSMGMYSGKFIVTE